MKLARGVQLTVRALDSRNREEDDKGHGNFLGHLQGADDQLSSVLNSRSNENHLHIGAVTLPTTPHKLIAERQSQRAKGPSRICNHSDQVVS